MNSVEELAAYITEKLAGDYDYNTHIEAIADITLAAFNLAASELGATGFSASHAELLFLQKSRRIDGPFVIIKAENCVYPQYDLMKIAQKYSEQWKPFLAQKAKALLDENDLAAPEVIVYWKQLVSYKDTDA